MTLLALHKILPRTADVVNVSDKFFKITHVMFYLLHLFYHFQILHEVRFAYGHYM